MQLADPFVAPLGALSVSCPSRASPSPGFAGGHDFEITYNEVQYCKIYIYSLIKKVKTPCDRKEIRSANCIKTLHGIQYMVNVCCQAGDVLHEVKAAASLSAHAQDLAA